MRIFFLIIIVLLTSSKTFSHSDDYKKIKKIEMNVLRNGEVIGYSNYLFEHKNKTMSVINNTNFEVKLFGVSIFSITSKALEKYENNKLIFFESKTEQNNKKKYVNLYYDKSLKKFKIDGSSFKGKAEMDCVIGNWWNHEILKANKQISPLSGSVKEQVVTYIGKENIIIDNKTYLTERFKLRSKDEKISDDKKLDFDIWYNPKNNLIMKVKYSKMGEWEYKIKKFE